MKKLSGWVIGGITAIVAFIVLVLLVFALNFITPGMGNQLWDFFSKLYLTNSLSNPVLDIITIVSRWALIGIIIGLLFDLRAGKVE